MNRSLDSKTQPSSSQLPLEMDDEIDDSPLPPMESAADFFNHSDDEYWRANRAPHTPEPEEASHISPVPDVPHSPFPPADNTPAPIEVFKFSSIPVRLLSLIP